MRRALLALLLLSGCTDVQTTSGADYSAARPDFHPADASAIDQAVDRSANVEPLLRFPARIGLARLEYGRIIPVPPREADAWIAFGEAHASYGSFVPISPLVAGMASSGVGRIADSVVNQVRLGAARQHIDAVLIYAVADSSKDHASVLSLLDLTIIGAYLVPSRSVAGEAVATGLLLDVRNGYPYGTASAKATATSFVPSVGSDNKANDLKDDATVQAVAKLTGELDTMMATLRTELDEKELTRLRAKQAAPEMSKPAAKSLPAVT
jgi:hypothetical protein